MSRTKISSSPSDFTFLQNAGFKVHCFNGNLCKRSSRNRIKEEEATKLKPEIFLKYLPRPQEEFNDTFKQDFEEFQYKIPQLKARNLSNTSAHTKKVLRMRPPQADKKLNDCQRLRLQLKTAFENLNRNKKSIIYEQNQEGNYSQQMAYNQESSTSSITLSLSQHLSRSGQVEISNQSSNTFKRTGKNLGKLRLPTMNPAKEEEIQSKRIFRQIDQMDSLTLSQRLSIQAELKKINAIKRQHRSEQAICEQVKKKKDAIRKYVRLLSFEERGYVSSDHYEIKKCLISIIHEEIVLFKPKIQQIQLQKQRKLTDNEFNLEQNFQHRTQLEVKRVMTRKIVNELSQSDDIQKLQLLQLKTDFKADRVKKHSKSHKSSKSQKKRNSKKKHKKRLNQSSQSLQYHAKKQSINVKYDSFLLQNLPVRNPVIKHQYNSQDHRQISFLTQFTRGTVFYASDLLSFNPKQHKFTINCKSKNKAFIEESIKTTRHCRELVPPVDSQTKKIKLKRNFEYTNKKILVLDLDETLVHSQGLNEIPNKNLFPFNFDFQKLTRHYAIRNYAIELIKNLSQMFYIVVFTSAVQGYADHILEHLDPQERYVQHRLYRSNCYLHGEGYPFIKDLRLLNRDLSQVIIVDNSLYAYWFQVDNGIPIVPFMGQQDWQLKRLEKYLMKLQNVDDIREINRRTFHMHLYQEQKNSEDVLEKYCELMNESLKVKQ